MKAEDKELLLKDLCGRLPYKIICNVTIHNFHVEEKDKFNHPSYNGNGYLYDIDTFYDYVRIRPILDNLRYEEKVYFEQIANEGYISINECKPYLRPMSSMTEEEKRQLGSELSVSIKEEDCGRHTEEYGYTLVYHEGEWYVPFESIDWLNEHHFDYRGLIEKGLAKAAPDGMYD